MQARRKRKFSILLMGLAAAVSFACSDEKKSGPELSLIDAPLDDDAEQERLRLMQMVRVTIDDPGFAPNCDKGPGGGASCAVSPFKIAEQLVDVCKRPGEVLKAGAAINCQNSYSGDECREPICQASVNYCVAQYLLEIAGLRAAPFKLPGGASIPPQSTATNYALMKEARTRAKNALLGAEDVLEYATDKWPPPPQITPPPVCLPSVGAFLANKIVSGGSEATLASFIGNVYADAARLYREATLKAVDLAVAVGDDQRSVDSLDLKTRRGVLGEDLSRTAAAHLLVGGDTGIGGSMAAFPRAGLCSVPDLTAQAQRAVDVFREAGVSPEDILNKSIELDDLLNSTSLPHKSVRQRLAQRWQAEAALGELEAQDGITNVARRFNLTNADFQEARDYLSNEILAFSRTLTKQMPLNGVPGFSVYAGTASRVPERLPIYWAALASSHQRNDGNVGIGGTNLADLEEGVAVSGAKWLKRGEDPMAFIGALRSELLDPVALYLSATKPRGRFEVRLQIASPQVTKVYAHGIAPSSELALVLGEDGLSCAVAGSVEGAGCSIFPTGQMDPSLFVGRLDTAAPAVEVALGYEQAAKFQMSGLPTSVFPKRLYLVRKPGGANPLMPGGAQVVAGIELVGPTGSNGGAFSNNSVAIAPDLDLRVAEILRPNRRSCSASAVYCDGTRFDERLPLEDELSSDGDNVESSWKHYLSLAQQAAQESDLLGEQYISHALEMDQHLDSSEMSQEDRERVAEERALAAIEEVQGICGSAVDPLRLLKLLRGTTASEQEQEGNDLKRVRGGSCGPATPCAEGYQCIVDRCVVDLGALANKEDDFELKRLAECLGTGRSFDFVQLGSKSRPLCLWYAGGETRRVCEYRTCAWNDSTCQDLLKQEKIDYPCPTLASWDKAADRFVCQASVMPPGVPSPSLVAVGRDGNDDNDSGPVRTSTLEYLSTTKLGNPKGKSKGSCAEALRAKNTGGGYAAGVEDPLESVARVRETNTFHPANSARQLGRVGFEARFGSYAALTIDGKPVYTTGSVETGPNTTAWPCKKHVDYDNLFCNLAPASAEKSLLCDYANCADIPDRARMNQRLLGVALDAARASNGNEVKVVYFKERRAEKEYDAVDLRSITSGGATFFEGTPRLKTDSGWATLPGKTYVVPAGQSITTFMVPTGIGAGVVESIPPTQGPLFFRYAVHFENQPDSSYFFGGLSSSDHAAGVSLKALTGSPLVDWSGGAGDPLLVLDAEDNTGAPNSYKKCASDDMECDPVPMSCKQREALGEPPCPPERDPVDALCTDAKDIPCDYPDAIADVGGLEGASRYLECLGQRISNSAASTVFSRFPRRAVDAMRKESKVGAFPAVGGSFGANVVALRSAVVDLAEMPIAIGAEVRNLGTQMENVRLTIADLELTEQAGEIQFMSKAASEINSCIQGAAQAVNSGTPWGGAASGAAAAANCVNSGLQIKWAKELKKLDEKKLDIAKRQAFNRFEEYFSNSVTELERYSIRLQKAIEVVDMQLIHIESDQNRAKLALVRALSSEASQSKRLASINAAMYRRLRTDRVRYESAFAAAKRMAFLAQRSIEMRIGQKLSTMSEDLPLVDAPSGWASKVCSTVGVDYARIAKEIETLDEFNPGDTKVAIPNGDYADAYIGEYVKKLGRVVESYRLTNAFHEGSDTAVISLRDDVQNVKTSCERELWNKLYHAGDLRAPSFLGTPGWERVGCPVGDVDGDGDTENLPNCVNVAPLTESAFANDTAETAAVEAFQLNFGATASLLQRRELPPGRYRFSWYQQADADTKPAGVIVDASGAPLATTNGMVAGSVGTWARPYRYIELTEKQSIGIGFKKPTGISLVKVAAPMLELIEEKLSTAEMIATRPRAFANTTDKLTRRYPNCEDTEGTVFRSTWHRGEARLCADGFEGVCPGSDAKVYDYWDLQFSINQRDIESGDMLTQAGFARGNFNYRIESIALNFVGTGVRDCKDESNPSTCNSAAYVPYTLVHDGPYVVRNHQGDDFQAYLFPGRIENARGLAAERYVTNPISATDRDLLTAYTRQEFQGRPLDGNFTLRVWDVPGLDFEAIRDAQIVLNYRYWTRFE